MTRQFLIQKFICSKCGELLELDPSATPHWGPYADSEPTGASKVESVIMVHPCTCTLKAGADLEAVRKILGVLK